MGKFIWGLLQIIFAVAVIAGLAYNYTETQRLSAEVARLKTHQGQGGKVGIALGKPISGVAVARSSTSGSEKIADPVSAQGHLQRAQTCLKKQDLPCFREEMAAAGQSAEKQGTDTLATIESTRRKAEELQKTISSLSQQAGKLWETQKKEPQDKPQNKIELKDGN
jgi:hypothetical protein